MGKIIYTILLLVIIACNTENAPNCFQTAGAITTEEITVLAFTKIRVNRDVELVLKEGVTQRVLIETGENLIANVEINVVNGELIIIENNTCNLARNYNITKIYVTAPNITEITSATQFKIQSEGVLNYTNIKILSEDFTDPSVLAIGDIVLQLNTESVSVVGNNLTHFTLSGITNNLSVNLAAGDGVFNGENLIANTVSVFHRGTNSLIVNPQNELTGELRSTGNLIAKNHPPIVNINELYTGRLIFE